MLKHFPVLGGLWLAGAVAITGAPPFALFLSELAIIRAGLAASQNFLIGLMAVLLIVIFVGFLNQFRIMYFEDGESNEPDVGAVTPWMIAPMGLAIVPLLVMGLWWPQAFWDFQTIALSLGGLGRAGAGAMIGTRARTLSPDELHRSPKRCWLREDGFASPTPGRRPRARWRCVTSRRFRIGAIRNVGREGRRELPSLAAIFPSLGWYEREMMDLNGLRFTRSSGALSARPQGQRAGVDQRRPRCDRSTPASRYRRGRRPALPFGPVRADVVGIRRIHVPLIGEHIIHYQPRLFFKHRGMETLLRGRGPPAGGGDGRARVRGGVGRACARLLRGGRAGRRLRRPGPGEALRVLLAEMERIYNHLHYLGHLCHTTTLKVGEAQGKLLEEKAKQLNARLTGSRFLRSLLVPGGLRRDLDPGQWLGDALESLREEFATYAGKLENSESHLDRLITTGLLPQKVAFDQGATGPVARASGVVRDLRLDHPYAHYDGLPLTAPTFDDGDAYARERVRMRRSRSVVRPVPAHSSAPRGRARSRRMQPGASYGRTRMD